MGTKKESTKVVKGFPYLHERNEQGLYFENGFAKYEGELTTIQKRFIEFNRFMIGSISEQGEFVPDKEQIVDKVKAERTGFQAVQDQNKSYAEKINDQNAKIATLEANISNLTKQIEILTKENSELKSKK